jgi:hypothetical protein
MRKPIHIEIPHRLGAVEARRRLQSGFGKLRAQSGLGGLVVDERWQENRLEFTAGAFGQKLVGRAEVQEEVVSIELDLPGSFAALGGFIRGRMHKAATLLLEKK